MIHFHYFCSSQDTWSGYRTETEARQASHSSGRHHWPKDMLVTKPEMMKRKQFLFSWGWWQSSLPEGALSCSGHEADQIKSSKSQELFCHHKNPENEASSAESCPETSLTQPYLNPWTLLWVKPGLLSNTDQNFSLCIKCFWVRYSITCYWKSPHWYNVK